MRAGCSIGTWAQAWQMLQKLLDETVLVLELVEVNGVRRYTFIGTGHSCRLSSHGL